MKIICTLGPATHDKRTLTQLLSKLREGDKLKLNTSYLSSVDLHLWLQKITSIRSIPVVVDLLGAKMRIGEYPHCTELPQKIQLILASQSENNRMIPIPHPSFFKSIAKGDLLLLNGATIKLRISAIGADYADAEVLTNGSLSSNKDIHRSQHPILFESLCNDDKKMIEVALEYPHTEFSFSFTHTGEEERIVRPLVGGRKLIAKLERPESLYYTSRIDDFFDETWFCRDDLSALSSPLKIGPMQFDHAKKIPSLKKPTYLAGQILQNMTHFKTATQSEIVHLFLTQQQKFAGIVLASEIAVGQNPLSVIDFIQEFRTGVSVLGFSKQSLS